MRGIKEENLIGLRKRIASLFLQYIKTPQFNPAVAKHLKVSLTKFDFISVFSCFKFGNKLLLKGAIRNNRRNKG